MPQSAAASDIVVRARDLSVAYGAREVLKNIDLTVRRGEVLALIGANGSGKSTLVRALIGLVPLSHGTVEILGQARLRRTQREQLGYVPQRVSAAGGVPATVTEIVRSGLHSGLLRRTTHNWRSAVDDALDATGLADLRSRSVADLSGGQQQRVLIARALARRPQLLIFDEPMAGVDLAQQAVFAQTLAGLSDDGHTIILVLHEFGAIAPLLNRVVSLAHGNIEFDARPDDVPQQQCDTNDQPEWVRTARHAVHATSSAHDHVHPHDGTHDASPEWLPDALPARGAHQ